MSKIGSTNREFRELEGEITEKEVLSKENENWLEKSIVSRDRGFENTFFYCICKSIRNPFYRKMKHIKSPSGCLVSRFFAN